MDLNGFINNLNEHICHYKILSDGNAREIIDFIKSKVIPLKIKLCFEHLSCIDKINKIKKEYEENSDLVRFENTQGIQDIVPRFRFILSSNRHKANFDIPFVRQCNGVILAIEEIDNNLKCRLLTVPPNDFNPKFNQTELIKLVSQGCYKIYEIQDGTTVNIFYDPNYIESENITQLVVNENDNETPKIKALKIYRRGKWIYSTKNAFDVNSMVWRGFNYKRVIDDVLKNYSLDFDKLSKNKTYTIGFKHPAFHPFGQPYEWIESDFENKSDDQKKIDWLKSAWFIQSVENVDNRLQMNISEDIGLPFQTMIEQKDGIPGIFKKLGNSLKEFINNLKLNQYMNNSKEKQVSPLHSAFLGLILRSNDEEKTTNLSDILLESALWQEIRTLIYQLPYIPNKTVREKQEQNFKNMTYVILDSFLDFKKRNVFIQVFPQYSHHYKKYDAVINSVVNKIYQDLLNTSFRSGGKFRNYDSEKNKPQQEREDPIVEQLYIRFSEIVKNQYQVTPETESPKDKYRKGGNVPLVKKPGMSKIDKKNIKNMIVNPKFNDIYFQAFYKE